MDDQNNPQTSKVDKNKLAVGAIVAFVLQGAFVTGCSEYYSGAAQADAYDFPTQPAPGTEYSLNGKLSESQVRDLLYLDFSQGQSYDAIKSRFGFPAYRDGQADFYQMQNGNYAAIYYDSNGRAIDFRLGDSF